MGEAIRGEHLPELTGLRGVAASLVWLYHTWTEAGSPPWAPVGIPLGWVASAGWVGVDVFFVLSGFVMQWAWGDSAAWRRGTATWRDFATRRVLRILPAYYVQFAVLIALAWAVGFGPALRWGDLIAHAALVHQFFPGFSQSFNPVWWTLPLELQFYLVFPLLTLVAPRVGWRALVATAIGSSLLWRTAGLLAPSLIGATELQRFVAMNQLPGRIDQFVLGMAVAHLCRGNRGEGGRRAVLFAGGGAAGGLLIAMALAPARGAFGPWVDVPATVLLGLLCAATVWGAVRAGAVAKVLAARIPRFLGDISYSLYLWHVIVLWALVSVNARHHFAGPTVLATLVGAPLVLTASFCSWRWIEIPGMALRRRLPWTARRAGCGPGHDGRSAGFAPEHRRP